MAKALSPGVAWLTNILAGLSKVTFPNLNEPFQLIQVSIPEYQHVAIGFLYVPQVSCVESCNSKDYGKDYGDRCDNP